MSDYVTEDAVEVAARAEADVPAAERLAQIRARAEAATEGPWAAWLDQDGEDHMNGLLMVGNADAVIPEGEVWIEGVEVNPIAHCYTPEDRAFIASARTHMPALIAALEAVLAMHGPESLEVSTVDGFDSIGFCRACGLEWGDDGCPTVAAIREALSDE